MNSSSTLSKESIPHFVNSVSSSISGDFRYSEKEYTFRYSGNQRSNWAHNEFEVVSELLADLSSTHPDSDFHVSRELLIRTLEVLVFLRYSSNVPAPKVLPESPNDLCLTWTSEDIKSYLAVSLDSIYVTAVNLKNNIECSDVYGDEKGIDYEGLLSILPATSKPISG